MGRSIEPDSVELTKYIIKDGRLSSTITSRSAIGCCSFMRNVFPGKEFSGVDYGISTINMMKNRITMPRDYIVFWTNRLKELDIDIEYFGIEGNLHIFGYKITKGISQHQRLARYTFIRYLWMNIMDVVVEDSIKMFQEDNEENYDFWAIFMALHAIASGHKSSYTATFSLTNANTYVKSTDESIKKLMTSKYTKWNYGINGTFSGKSFYKSFTPKELSSYSGRIKAAKQILNENEVQK